MRLTFTAQVERQPHGSATIHLVTLPDDEADFLTSLGVPRGGFGSMKVKATIGNTTWRTSIFPTTDTFILLLSRKLLTAERIEADDVIAVGLEVIIQTEAKGVCQTYPLCPTPVALDYLRFI